VAGFFSNNKAPTATNAKSKRTITIIKIMTNLFPLLGAGGCSSFTTGALAINQLLYHGFIHSTAAGKKLIPTERVA
jgi:hypothetical protein